MGVKGLWDLISPVARTVKLESLNNKRLAIDASIWLYQFLTAMRDKEGNRLKNAHLLGFFRRICKLLFYNIKPVFVFDGGAPELKRLALNERRKRRTGNTNNLRKTAEKLLAAQLRLHAIQNSKESNSKKIKESRKTLRSDDVVYSDELKVSSEEQLRRRKRDEYDLPPISGGIESMAIKDDPRLATEEDLRNFIREFKPEEIDVDSETFRSLPLEAQHEIIGELRIKSRQTSWDRFQEMVNNAPNFK
ncbi:XPG N-terminal domain-containing protein [Glomus cerebriforme]|uniref:XPG N-terminal domain-containing protein n=1 Tax=Glomus cerebriforme TaxID=658196 RepID=A0A397SIM3_9GLOM|nr:XPG N-terminal domain-containing protein [Glomus cerebriforme]